MSYIGSTIEAPAHDAQELGLARRKCDGIFGTHDGLVVGVVVLE